MEYLRFGLIPVDAEIFSSKSSMDTLVRVYFKNQGSENSSPAESHYSQNN